MPVNNPLISVIITSYTMERLQDVCELLDSLKRQTYPHLEIIFVAEGSQDFFGRVEAHGKGLSFDRFKTLFNHGQPGLSEARNVGIEAARGELIAFLDDDAVATPEWAEQTVRTYQDESIVGVCGPAIPLWEDPSMSWVPREFYWLISCTGWMDWNTLTDVRNAWGHNMSFRRDAFVKGGLFDGRYGYHRGPFAEDVEFSLRAKKATGGRIVYNPETEVYHHVHKYRFGWQFIKDRSFWIGRSRGMIRKVYGQSEASEDLLTADYQLVGRIVTRVPFRILKGLFTQPSVALQQLRLVSISSFFLGLGFLSGTFSPRTV